MAVSDPPFSVTRTDRDEVAVTLQTTGLPPPITLLFSQQRAAVLAEELMLST